MGLQMTLPKDKNHMATEFVDAYWAVTELGYDFVALHFKLVCFPSREAKLLDGNKVEEPSLGGYGLCEPTYHPKLYSWEPFFTIETVFPEGIPLGRDAQLKVIYSFIKDYTGLPFEDVFEDDQKEDEPIVEPSEPTEPTEPIEEPTEEPIEEPSAAEVDADEETVTEEATETTEEETEDVE